jgi:NADH-quinone oxidoreductase subunit M
VMLSSVGVPGLNGFVGEFMILIGSFRTARWYVTVAAAGVILAALYLLWAYQRVFHGEPNDDNKTFRELKLSEGLVLLPLIGLIVFSGVYPKPMLDRIEPSVQRILTALDKQLVSPQNPDAQETTDDGEVVEVAGEVKK